MEINKHDIQNKQNIPALIWKIFFFSYQLVQIEFVVVVVDADYQDLDFVGFDIDCEIVDLHYPLRSK
jgi:hypothetical protein